MGDSDLSSSDVEVFNQLLDPSKVDPDDNFYRLRVGNQVKYLTIEPGVFTEDVLSFPPDLLLHLPPLPPGNWAHARVARGHDGNPELHLVHIAQAGVCTVWHSNRVEFLSLDFPDVWRSGVQVIRYDSRLVVAKYSNFDFDIDRMERETAAYQAIDGHGIGPAFLGHIVEGGRVIRILIELVQGRAAGLGDIQGCRNVLERLHTLDIIHRDPNRYNFVVGSDGSVTLIDFEAAFSCTNTAQKDQELATLPSELSEETGRGRAVGFGM